MVELNIHVGHEHEGEEHEEPVDYKEIKVSDLLTHKHDKIIYEYDF